MNILFVNYGDFTSNSLNHIGGFANWLIAAGHACTVAVPAGLETVASVHQPRFRAVSFADVLAAPTAAFGNGRAADVIHAWTPREAVRKFILAHQRLHPATRVIVHLEDNEEHLTATFAGESFADLAALADDELQAKLPDALSHPRRARNLLRVADGATVITDRLREFLPAGVPSHLLLPGVDPTLYHPQPASRELRHDLGIPDGDKIIVYTGSTTFANQAEVRELVRAVQELNRQGVATRLVRTGFHPPDFFRDLNFDPAAFTIDAGFVPKTRLPQILALADVLVQPGRPGRFDDYRLPSKLPEFLAMGKPVILPATNVGRELRDGEDALLSHQGTADEIVALCLRVLRDPALAARLGANAAAFAKKQFDPATIGAGLVKFYEDVRAAASRAAWSTLGASLSESSLLPAQARSRTTDPELLALLQDIERALGEAETRAARGLAQELQAQLRGEIADLTTRLALTEKHATNVAEALHETRRGNAGLKVHIRQLDARIEELRRLAHNFQAELVRSTAEQEQLKGKIRRMQESFSWKATAFLRALRRQFLDRPEPAPAPAAPAPSRGPRYHLDEPAYWHQPAGTLVISGWCLLPDGKPAARVRVRLNNEVISGLARQERPDVAVVQGEAAGHSGIAISLVVEPGRHHLAIEVADEAGHWFPMFDTALNVFAPAHRPRAASYEHWLRAHGPAAPAPANGPLISILMPVYNTPESWLQRAIDSVRAQTYTRWELCIADDASPAAHVRPLLEAAARSDSRIKVSFRESNGHISRASNSALELATGQFIALLDHDDELAPEALAEVVRALAQQPKADVIYSDEDKIDEQGRRFSPYFKPDFLPDLFLAQNYLTHLAVYRASLLRSVGGFRAGFEGSQDWDLALRVIEKTSPDRIVHIPKVLYHWRAIPGSTALGLDQKAYHVGAAQNALEEHFARTGKNARIEPVPGDHWRVRYALPRPAPLVSIIIPTRNGVRHLRRCLDSIFEKTTYPDFEVIVVDNGSDDPVTLAYLKEIAGKARVLPYPHPFNYSAINNHAVQQARGEIVALLNDDLEVITPGWLEEMVSHAVRPEIGCVGAMLYYPDNTIQHAGVILGVGGLGGVDGVAGHAFKKFPKDTDGYFNRARVTQNYSAVTAACLVVRRATYLQVGGLDEKALAIAFNDVDFCLKVRAAGYRNLWTPFAEFYHHESASRGAENTPAKQMRFKGEIDTMLERWGPLLRADPAYNPNLSLETEDFALAWPPRLPEA